MYSSPLCIVRTTMRARDSCRRIALMASSPLMPRRFRSIKVISGLNRANSSTASSPDDAVPTTSMSGCLPMMSASPSRTMRWSSTQRILMECGFSMTFPAVCILKWDRRLDARALALAAFNGELTADILGPFAHAGQAVVRRSVRCRRVRVEARAVVHDAQRQRAVGRLELDGNAIGMSMARRVDDRLAPDLQQLLLETGRIGARRTALLKRQLDLAAVYLALACFTQCGGEVVRVETRRAEIGNRLACLADVLLHALAHPDELPSLRRRGELRIVGHRVELQGDADEALQQRIVQFAAQARTLSDEQCELLAHAPHVQAPRCRDRGGHAEHGQREEPGGLVEHRSDRQWQRGYGGTRPAALGIRRHDRERVVARRQVRVEGLAARPGVDPFNVEAFQLVA